MNVKIFSEYPTNEEVISLIRELCKEFPKLKINTNVVGVANQIMVFDGSSSYKLTEFYFRDIIKHKAYRVYSTSHNVYRISQVPSCYR